MAEIDVVIAGNILLDRARRLDGAAAEVRLRDATLADAAAPRIASVRIDCSGRSVAKIGFRLAARVDPDVDYSLVAEVRQGGGDRLRPGDLLTTAHHPWRADGPGEVMLRVEPIS